MHYEQEINELNSILGSRALQNLLVGHKEHLQKEVNQAVRDNNIMKAYGNTCRLDDVEKILSLIQLRISELKGEKNGK